MKKFSKVKYFGAVAAALLAVAPIAAPVISQVASPAIAQAADAAPIKPTRALTSAGSSSEQALVMAGVKAALPSATYANTSAKVNDLISMVNAIKPSTNSNDAVPYNRFFNNSVDDGNKYVGTTADAGTASAFNAQTTDGSKGSAFTYTISGNGIASGASQQAIANNIENAKYAGKAVTYTITVTGYDLANNQIVKLDAANSNPYTFTVTISPSATATNNASATFKNATVQAPAQAPGAINIFGSIAGDISVKGASGTAYTINANNDLQSPVLYAAAGTTFVSGATGYFMGFDAAKTGVQTINGAIDTSGQWSTDAIFNQAVELSNGSTNVANLKADLAYSGKFVGGTPITADASGFVADANGKATQLFWDKGTLYLVRQVTVKADKYNSLLPKVLYQYATLPTKPVQYTEGQTVSLNTGDWNTLNAPYYDNSNQLVNNTVSVQALASALVKIVGGLGNLNTQANATDTTAVASPITSANAVAAVKAAAQKAGLTIASNGDGDTFTKGGSFSVPVTYANAAGYTTTVYLPLTGMTPAQTQDAPVVEYRNGSKQNVTLTVGDVFDYAKDMTVYTDGKKNQTLDPAYWNVTPKTIDTSKPGQYEITYVLTNPATGQATTIKREVTVKSSGKTEFDNINSVIYVQTSKSPQYKYDGKTDTFTKDTSIAALPLSSAWKTTKKATASDGTVYYIVGGNGYLKASDVTTAKVTKTAGVVTVTNEAGTNTTANTTKDSGKVQYLANNSAWKYFAIATNPDGSRAYLVADNQWVSANDVVERVNSASGTFTVGSDAAPVFNGAGNVLKGQTLKARSSWKVTGVKNINGKPYYRVSTDGYVRADYGSYKA